MIRTNVAVNTLWGTLDSPVALMKSENVQMYNDLYQIRVILSNPNVIAFAINLNYIRMFDPNVKYVKWTDLSSLKVSVSCASIFGRRRLKQLCLTFSKVKVRLRLSPESPGTV